MEQMLSGIFFPERLREGKRIVQFVLERLQAKHNDILYVCGNCGCGKTSTVQKLPSVPFGELVQTERSVTVSYVNCADLTAKDFCLRLIEATSTSRKKQSAVGLRAAVEAMRDIVETQVMKKDASHTLRVIVLDEVEAARATGKTEIQRFCDLALKLRNETVAVIIVSNMMTAFHVNPKRLQSITFSPYSIPDLVSIASRDDVSNKVDEAVIRYAAKVCTSKDNGDVRKMMSLCAIGASEAKERKGTIRDLINGVNDLPNTKVPLIKALPQQMLFVLCCCGRLHRDTLEARPGALVSLPLRKVYQLYEATARRVGMAALSVTEVRSCLTNLVDQSLLSGGKQDEFGYCVHESELKDALSGDEVHYVIAREAAGLKP